MTRLDFRADRAGIGVTGPFDVKGWSEASWPAPAVIGHSDENASAGADVSAYPVGGIWLVEAPSLVRAVAERAIFGILMALAESPPGVVGHFGGSRAVAEDPVLDALASLGRYVDRWPGAPVVISAADPEVADAIRSRPYGDRLELAPSLLRGWSKVRMLEPPERATLHIPPHPVAGRLAEHFGARTCQEWGVRRAAAPVREVLRELTSYAVEVTHHDVDVSLDLHRDKIRVAVRSDIRVGAPTLGWIQPDPAHPGRQPAGVPTATLPVADGGSVTWAVVHA